MATKKRHPKQRLLRLLFPPDRDGQGGILEIRDSRGRASTYKLSRREAGVWLVERYDISSRSRVQYTVRLGKLPGCTCKGHRVHGKCKHRDAVAKLAEIKVIV